MLKHKLDEANNVIYQLKRERNEFREGNAQLRKDVEKMAAELRRDRRAFVQPMRITDGINTGMVSKAQPELMEIPCGTEKAPSNMRALITNADTFVEITANARNKSVDSEQSLNSVHEGNATVDDFDKRTKEENVMLDEIKKELASLKDNLQNTEGKVAEEMR